jgi:peptidylprolyl isomerase
MRHLIAVAAAAAIALPVVAAAGPSPKPIVKKSTHPPAHKAQNAKKIVTLPDGLKYIDEVVGKGPQPKVGQTIRVHYVGTLASNGHKFDSSRDRNEPFEFQIGVGQVIKGWDEGVMSMHVGGKRKLMIPAKLGYGERGAGGVIPPNADLVFDVELLEIVN